MNQLTQTIIRSIRELATTDFPPVRPVRWIHPATPDDITLIQAAVEDLDLLVYRDGPDDLPGVTVRHRAAPFTAAAEYAALPGERMLFHDPGPRGSVTRRVPAGLSDRHAWNLETLHAALPDGSIQLEFASHTAGPVKGDAAGVITFALHAGGNVEWLATLGGSGHRSVQVTAGAPRPPAATLAQRITLARMLFKPNEAYVLYPGAHDGLDISVQVWADLTAEQAVRLAGPHVAAPAGRAFRQH